MSDIFLSYASADHERVHPLVRALEQHGWARRQVFAPSLFLG